MADLQELVDDLAAEIGRPISVEDRRFRLVAHSAHTGDTDAVRRATIMTREAPPGVPEWLESLGVLRAAGPVDIPENEALGMAPRVCTPVRHRDVLLGFVWVVVGERPLDDAERGALARVAVAAEELLWERRTAHEAQQHLVRTLLEDDDAAAVRHARIELGAALRLADDARIGVAVAVGGEDCGERLRRRWPHGGVAWAPRPPGLVAVAALGPSGTAGELAEALVAAGAARAVAGEAAPGLAAGAGALRQADLGLLAAAASGAPAATTWSALGGWALVVELWDAAGRPVAPEAVLRLTAHPELTDAVEAVLAAGGDVAAAAEALHLHRATLYRRLARAREVCGLDAAVGDDRLVLALGLRMWRLAGAAAGAPSRP